MKTKNILLRVICSFLIMTSVVYGQEKEISVNKNLFKINLLPPGITYEHGFTNKLTLNSDVNAGISYHYNSFSGSDWIIFPYIDEQLRHYYNLEKRSLKGKRTANNSANFLAVGALYMFRGKGKYEYINDLDGFNLYSVWGLQRTYNSKININLNMGLGYNFSQFSDVRGVKPIVNFTLGWVIGK